MIVRERQQHHGVADTYDAGALRDCAIEHCGRGGMGKAGLEMMFHGPEMREAYLFCQVHLLEHLVKDLILALAMLQRAIDLDLVENAEIHRCPPDRVTM